MAELLDNEGLLEDNQREKTQTRYKVLMWIFVLVNPLLFGWTNYLFSSVEMFFLFGIILIMFYPVGLFLGLVAIDFSIQFAFDMGIFISKTMGKNDWWDSLFATKTRVGNFIKQHQVFIMLFVQFAIFFYLLYSFRISSFYYEVFLPNYWTF